MATIQGIYIALFGRPADPLGLAFWESQTANGADLTKLINGDPATGLGPLVGEPEYTDRFAGMSNVEIVNSIYQSLFGHDADLAGLTFYVNQLTSGAQDIATIAINIYDGAQGTDLATLENKEVAADQFTAELDTTAEIVAYNGSTLHLAQEYLENITSDPATIPSEAEAEATVEAIVDLNAGGVPGDTIILETGPEILSGGVNNDLFVAVQTATDDTLDAGDELNGLGGSDTLRVTNTGGDVDLGVADINSIENVDIRVSNTTLASINLADSAGEFETARVDLNGGTQANNLVISGVNTATELTVSDADFQGNGLYIEYNAPAGDIASVVTLNDLDDTYVELDSVDGGGADALTLNVSGLANSNGDMDFYIESIENLTINVTGDSTIGDFEAYSDIDGDQTVLINLEADLTIEESLDLTDDAQPALLTIVGAGDLTIADLGDTSGDPDLTVDASAATGNIDLGTVESQVTGLEVTLGSGDDRVALADGFDLSVIRSLDGGDGQDILGLDGDLIADIGTVDQSGFETLEVTGAAGADVLVDADDNGFTSVILSADVVNDITVEDLSGDVTISSSQAGIVTFTPEGGSDDLGITFNAGTGVTLFELDVSGYTAANFISASEDDDVTFTTLTADSVDTLAFAGGGDVTINALSSAGVGTLDLSGLEGVFSNAGAPLDLGTDVSVGNVGSGSQIYLDNPNATPDGTNVLTFGAELDNTVNFVGFEGGVGGDILDLSALGVTNFADLTITDNGADTTITSADDFGGTIVLVGVVTADLDGVANFQF